MLGMLFNERECMEFDYLLRKELDEILYDLQDKELDVEVRYALERRYQIIFRMFARLASPKELAYYVRNYNTPTQI